MSGAEPGRLAMARLDGRVAIAFGASPSINAGIVLALASEGATVVCVDRDEAHAKSCADDARSLGVRALALVADVSDEKQVRESVERAVREYGGIDVLVNGVATTSWHGLLDATLEEFRSHFDVIVGSAFTATQLCAASMIEQGRRGCVINILSTEAHQGRPGNIGYGVAKAALAHFTKCVAMELAEYGIRVNSVTPTATDPGEGRDRAHRWGVSWAPEGPAPRPDFTAGDQGIPLGRRPSPWDYGRAVAYLASDDARMVTGFDLRVDGGAVSRYWRFNPGTEITA
jgi:NAD(P)-dependent dehydrogenase (short-subunit alcohol dehydrogenase family)